MRIAILTTSYPQWEGDAAGHFVAAEARELMRDGHRVSVFCPRDPQHDWCHPDPRTANPAVFSANAHGASGFPGVLPRIRARPWRLFGLLFWLWSARRWLEEQGPFDRLICHWLFPGAWPLARYTRNSAKLECVVHGSDARLLARLPRLVQRSIVRGLLERGARFRCVSEELAELLRRASAAGGSGEGSEARDVSPDTCISVHPPVLEVEVPLSRSAARKQLNVMTPAPLVVIASRLIASKRVEVALNALRLAEITDIVVLGDGPEQATLARKFPEARFMGQVPRPVALLWMRAADLVLSASLLEGAPSVIREARALGTGVVANRCGDLAQQAERDAELWVLDHTVPTDSDTSD